MSSGCLIGLPAERGELILRKRVRNPGDSFRIVLPGGVTPVGRTTHMSIIPQAILVAGQPKGESVILKFGATENEPTQEALKALENTAGAAPYRFDLVIEGGFTFEDVMRGLANGRYTRGEPGELQIRAQIQADGEVLLSKPFEGEIVVADGANAPSTLSDESDHYFFDCHSHWEWGWRSGRYTVCHGPCAGAAPGGPDCLTLDGKKWDYGWHLCFC